MPSSSFSTTTVLSEIGKRGQRIVDRHRSVIRRRHARPLSGIAAIPLLVAPP
jgi:hypothetical protein